MSVHVVWSEVARSVQTLLDGCSTTPGLGKQKQLYQLAAKQPTCDKALTGVADGYMTAIC